MKIVIFGSRNFNNYFLLKNTIEETEAFKQNQITAIISGAAKGADKLGERWAIETNTPIISMPAEWDKYGKRAGYLRNKQMAQKADAAIGFWDGKSVGTRHMINICKNLNLPIIIYREDLNTFICEN